MKAPFLSYAPDLPPFGNQGTTAAKNIVAHAGGFRPLPSLNPYSDALTARCQGAVFAVDKDGNVNGFAGDASKLYRLAGGSTGWVDESKALGYSTPIDGRWSFARFGERIVATNFADPVQSYLIGTSSDFADLAGSPPQAKYAVVMRPGFLVLARLSGQPVRLQWSAIFDPTNWPTPGTSAARIVQSDFQDLEGDGGEIRGISAGLAGADGAIVRERALHRMLYTGPPEIFTFRTVENGRGSPAPGSLAQIGGVLYYLGEDGFYRFDGQSSQPIGGSRVDRTFFNTVDSAKFHLIDAAVDPVNKFVLWAYPDGSAGDINNRLLIYNWEIDEWTPGEALIEQMLRSLSFGVDMDTDLNVTETILDDVNWPSLDSEFWKGGRPGLAAFDSSHRLAFMNGAPLDAELETGDFQIRDSQVLVNHARPLIETNGQSPSITVQFASRYKLTDMTTYKQAYAPTVGGNVYVRSRGRYHRAKVTISGGAWDFAQGLEVDGTEVGG